VGPNESERQTDVMFQGAGALGDDASLTIGPRGTVDFDYDVVSGGALSIEDGGVLTLDQRIEFAEIDLSGTGLSPGTYDCSALSTAGFGMMFVDGAGVVVASGGSVSECACPGNLTGDGQIDLEDLQAVAGILLQAGSPFVVPVGKGHCGDINGDLQIDLEDLQAMAGILLNAGSPFVVPCP